MSDSIQDGTCFEKLRELSCFPCGRNHRTLPTSIPPKVVTKPCVSLRNTIFGQATPHFRPNFQIDIWRGGTEGTRSGTDGPGASLEPCPLRDTTDFRGQLATSFTPNRCRHQATADSNHCDEDIRFHLKLCAPYARLTTAPRYQMRRPCALEAGVKDGESSTIGERQQRLVTIDDR